MNSIPGIVSPFTCLVLLITGFAAASAPAREPAASSSLEQRTNEHRALIERLATTDELLRSRLLALAERGLPRAEALDLLDRVERLVRGLSGPTRALAESALPEAESRELRRRLTAFRTLLPHLRRLVERGDAARLRNALARPLSGERDAPPGRGFGGTAQIRGFITGEPFGTPVGDGDVSLYSRDGFVDFDFVDFDGSYSFSNLAAGTYFVLARGRDAGFTDELYDNLPCGGLGGPSVDCDPLTGTPIVVADGQIVSGIDFRLSRGAVLAGRLRDAATLAPIAFQSVELWSSTGFIDWADTDSAGRYRFTGLVAGTYFLRTSTFSHRDEIWDDLPCTPASCQPSMGTPIVVQAEELRAGLDFELDSLGAIDGRLTDAVSGQPIAFERIQVLSISGLQETGFTDAEGNYHIGGLEPDTYFVVTDVFSGHRDEIYDDLPCTPASCVLTSGIPVSVSSVGSATGIDFALERLGELHGTLTDSGGGPFSGFANIAVLDSTGLFQSFVSVDGDGTYRARGLHAGSYRVQVQSSSHLGELFDNVPCASPGCPTGGATLVPVVLNGVVNGIDFELDKRAVVRGRITEAGSGAALQGAFVTLWNTAGTAVTGTTTGFGGDYVIGGIDAGTYYVTADTGVHQAELYDEIPCAGSAQTDCNLGLGTPVLLTINQEAAGIDFTLVPMGEITGRITDAATGLPLDFADVRAWRADGSFAAFASADFDGSYRFRGLPDGNYFITAHDFDYAGALYDGLPCDGPSFPGCAPQLGTPVPSTTNTVTANIDLALTFSGPGIVGTVTEQGSGAPLAGVAIDFWDILGRRVNTVLTNAAGAYQARFFSGTYYVSTDADLGTGDEVWNDRPCPLGPASLGLCNPLLGSPITVSSNDGGPHRADFELSVVPLFADGFETGDTSAWSASVP